MWMDKRKTTDIGHSRINGLPHGMEPNFVCGIYILSNLPPMSTVVSVEKILGLGGEE